MYCLPTSDATSLDRGYYYSTQQSRSTDDTLAKYTISTIIPTTAPELLHLHIAEAVHSKD